jgi:hypothetical protein
MTVRTDWAQVGYRVDLVLARRKGEWLEVVDMNEVPADGAIALFEAEATDEARATIVIETGCSGLRIPLVGIYPHLLLGTLGVILARG